MRNVTSLGSPESPNGQEVLVPESRAAWRKWLAAHPDRPQGLWVAYRKKTSDLEGPVYDDLVEEALCFGWIDSRVQRLDDYRVLQWFSPRRPGGLWSALNKERVEALTRQGLMTETGQRVIDAAIADGSWSQLDDVDGLVVPDDLAAALAATPMAAEAFASLPDSVKKQHLWWIKSAKRETTRTARIDALTRELGSTDAS